MIDKPCTVYRFYDEHDALLYVGMSIHCATRTGTHKVKDWWPEVARATFEHFPAERLARVTEAWAIRDENPRYNRQHPGHYYTTLTPERVAQSEREIAAWRQKNPDGVAA